MYVCIDTYMCVYIDTYMYRFLICLVLALDSWNNWSGQQGPTAKHLQDYLIFFIQLTHLYKTKIKQNKVLSPYDNCLCHKVAHILFFTEAKWGNDWEEDVGLLGLALQSKTSNCLVLIPDRQLEKYLLSTGESNGKHLQDFIQVNVDTY